MPLAGKIIVTVGGIAIVVMLAYSMYQLWRFGLEVKVGRGQH